MTKGEKRVRIDFNTSNNTRVAEIKKKTAELINLVDGLSDNDKNGEFDPAVLRLKSLAMTSYEEAAMWAVKAKTAHI